MHKSILRHEKVASNSHVINIVGWQQVFS